MATQGAIVVDKERCKGCGVCVVNCPTEAIALSHEVNGKGYNFLSLNCATVCPDSVITVYRVKI